VATAVTESRYKALIKSIYKDKNPSKLDDVDALLKKYDGREHDLFRQVCEKYKVNPDELILGGSAEGGSGDMDDIPALSATEYAVHIQTIYEKYNPKKLQDLARLLTKYRKRERELFQEVCKKYAVSPASFVQVRKVKGEY